MRALIVYNDYYFSPAARYCADRLSSACRKKDIEVSAVSGARLILDESLLKGVDFVLMRSKDPSLAKFCENTGIRVFNSSDALRICDDKSEMSVMLGGAGVRRPMTIISPETYGNPPGKDFLISAANILKYPFIIKKAKSSLGKGVYMVSNREELARFYQCKDKMIFEEYIRADEDIRVFVIGDRISGCMKRMPPAGEFRTNIEQGAKGSKVAISDEVRALAISAVRVTGADYAGVDIIDTLAPRVLEVNANANFMSLDQVNGADTAKDIIDYIIKVMK